ncbi:MAG TPA: hypothetical protein VLC51_03075 [Nitrospira sp.]|nr:hypothetical protein [Nitrospira sp.]
MDETTHEQRLGLQRVLALLVSHVLIRPSTSPISQALGHDPLASGVRLRRFPKIHTVTRYLKALVRIEDPFYVLGTRHMHDPESERMAIFISQNLREHHRSKRDESLTKLVIGAK